MYSFGSKPNRLQLKYTNTYLTKATASSFVFSAHGVPGYLALAFFLKPAKSLTRKIYLLSGPLPTVQMTVQTKVSTPL